MKNISLIIFNRNNDEIEKKSIKISSVIWHVNNVNGIAYRII
jgi:hypothetical protein